MTTGDITVGQLIELLSIYDPEEGVYLFGNHSGEASLNLVSNNEVIWGEV